MLQRPSLTYLHTTMMPIFAQLQLEEALLRVSKENICLINRGSPPAIVLGISGKPEEWINLSAWSQNPVPVLRRYSGGGTVVVDENTLFVTFIMNGTEIAVPSQIQAVHAYFETLWQKAFYPHPFRLIENDYVLGSRKVGGNAQYLARDRWVHHTSFLWDFKPEHMGLLARPPKMPSYRQERGHLDFLTTLSSCFTSADELLSPLVNELSVRFSLSEGNVEELSKCLTQEYRRQTMQESLAVPLVT
ncbi:lipoate--protein ligase family protein [Estrella lausannensis]|uniref:Putative lipoate-protein ligase A n=1 Tax=Estrella lausannensis TaxID=483423 RepID=A0A0H5DNV5_9BACT|nr:lipoate--protein ligase family protein [Estrella lausannensis]CRX37533.1 Putative lipoate-protein ligase A [Estrella lausannensis]